VTVTVNMYLSPISMQTDKYIPIYRTNIYICLTFLLRDHTKNHYAKLLYPSQALL